MWPEFNLAMSSLGFGCIALSIMAYGTAELIQGVVFKNVAAVSFNRLLNFSHLGIFNPSMAGYTTVRAVQLR